MEEYSIIGKSVPRVDAVAKITGEAKYVNDMVLPRMLYGKILRSKHPHAKILNVNVTRAQKLPGVKAIITWKDTPGKKYGFPHRDSRTFDKYCLARDKVRFVGDEIAAVAAIDEETAAEALALIEVDYQELSPVFAPEEALKPEAPKIHEAEKNIAWEAHYHFGDVEKGFRESDHIREDRFETKVVAHCSLEPHAVLASADASGKLTVWLATQSPKIISYGLSMALGIPEGKIRVIKPHMGGGYGGKLDFFSHEICASLLSQKTRLPVKIVLSREEVFTATVARHPFIILLKTGAKKDGTLLAMHYQIIVDNGAYNSAGPGVVSGASRMTLVYRLPNLKYDGLLVYTNKMPGGAYEGFGDPQRDFALESQIDMIAEDLGMDPLAIRLKNARRPNEITASKCNVTSCGLTQCLKQVAAQASWSGKGGQMPKNNGLGLACYGYTAGSLTSSPFLRNAAALVNIREDGSVIFFTGAAEMGQGSDTVLSQIVAEELGIGMENVKVISADTEATPHDPGSWYVTFLSGNAVKAAASDAKRQLFLVAAEKLEAHIDDLVARDGRIFVKGSPEKGISFSDAISASLAAIPGKTILGRGAYGLKVGAPDPDTGEGDISATYCFGARIAKVMVEPDSGQIKVEAISTAHDWGFPINPRAAEGVMEGSTLRALGMTLTEELLCDGGSTLNPSFLDYRLPTALDAPPIKPILVASLDPGGPFGAKAGAQSLQGGVAAAVANALYQALGVRFTTLPISPDAVLTALEGKARPKSGNY